MTSILFLVEAIQRKQFRYIYRKNKKLFLNLFGHFSKSTLNFEHFQKNVTLMAYVFPKLRTRKHVIRKMSKKSRLRGPLDRQQGKRAETLIQSKRKHL